MCRAPGILGVLLLTAILATACSLPRDEGQQGGVCYPNNTCNANLECVRGTCVASNDGGAANKFSFFVTSLRSLQELSGSPDGFGGDLRFGETGPGAGLRGADKICATIAERSMPGAGQKVWRAFLSAAADENGQVVHAIERIGPGPWYDRLGRLVAETRADLLYDRPAGADPAIIDDLPNENGVPNHQPDPAQPLVDNHDILTGSNIQGRLYGTGATCLDWTSAKGDHALEGRPRVGHSWPRRGTGGLPGMPDGGMPMPPGGPPGMPPHEAGMPPPPEAGWPPPHEAGWPPPHEAGMPPNAGFPGQPTMPNGQGGSMDNWMSALDEAGCTPGVNLLETGAPKPNEGTVGSGGGYGGFYCFALTP